MNRAEPSVCTRRQSDHDLNRRIARFRARLEAEGRPKAMQLLDKLVGADCASAGEDGEPEK